MIRAIKNHEGRRERGDWSLEKIPMESRQEKAKLIHGALIGALFMGFVGFNVGYLKGGPGDGSQQARIDPPVADAQTEIAYRWELPIAALGLAGEALLGAVIGVAFVGLAGRCFGERGARNAVILLGALGGACVGYSVAGCVAREWVIAVTAHSRGHITATRAFQPNAIAALVAVLLGECMGALAGRGVLETFTGSRAHVADSKVAAGWH